MFRTSRSTYDELPNPFTPHRPDDNNKTTRSKKIKLSALPSRSSSTVTQQSNQENDPSTHLMILRLGQTADQDRPDRTGRIVLQPDREACHCSQDRNEKEEEGGNDENGFLDQLGPYLMSMGR
jgi:hypothetical protein